MLTPETYQPDHLSGNRPVARGRQELPNLEVGFPLICFQRLSRPNIATRRCPWQDSRYTRGSFFSVLSSHISLISKGADYIFILSLASDGSWRIIALYFHNHPSAILPPQRRQSRYGVNPKILNNSFLLFFLFVT